MTLTRRSFVAGGGLLGLTAALASCGEAQPGSDRATASGAPAALGLWYWPGGLSEKAVTATAAATAARVKLTASVVDGDYEQKLTTAFGSKRDVPDIAGVKGQDMPASLERSAQFLDLNTLGAGTIAGQFVGAKYAQATTEDGRQLGLPIDLGPTALFYRADLWEKAGLPVDPAAVSTLMRTWDGWFDAAHRIREALPGTFAIRGSTDVFGVALAQQPETFISRDGQFIGDTGGAKVAWDLAVRSITEGVQAGLYDTPALNTALTSGSLTGHVGPAWMGEDIRSGAPSTSGSWRIAATPGGPGNIGGSFLTLPSSCREPALAFACIRELLTPANEARGFADASLFPAVTAAYSLPELTRGEPFYGGQSTITVLGPAAKNLPVTYDSPRNSEIVAAYGVELGNVEGGKNAAQAWNDAVKAGAGLARASG